LSIVYPEWNIPSKPNRYWQDHANQMAFIQRLSSTMNIQKQEDWYNVTLQDVERNGGSGLLRVYGGSLIKGNETYWRYQWQ
jgi:hypothetical protein